MASVGATINIMLAAVLAEGVNAEVFNGYYDNTDIFNKLAEMLNVQ